MDEYVQVTAHSSHREPYLIGRGGRKEVIPVDFFFTAHD